MVAPLVVGAVGLSAMLGGLYEGYSAFENRLYWRNYRDATGRSPAYPFRSGYSNLGRFSYITGRLASLGYLYSPETPYLGYMPSAFNRQPYAHGYIY